MGHPILQSILEGQYRRGLQLYGELHAPFPQDDRWAGYCHFAQGDLLTAKDLLARAWARGTPEAAIELATTYRYLGDFSAARDWLTQLPWPALDAFDRSLAERESGMLHIASGQLDQGRQALERAWVFAQGQHLTLVTGVALALGWAEALAGFDGHATHYFGIAVTHSQGHKHVQALATRGLSLIYAGQYDQAERDLKEASVTGSGLPALAPQLAYTWGVYCRAQGRWQDALRHFQNAIQLADACAEVDSAFFGELGACAVYSALGQFSDAQATLNRAAKHNRETRKAAFWQWRATVLRGLQGDPSADQALREVAQTFRTMGLHREAAWVTLHAAEASARTGKAADAHSALQSAIDLRHLLGSGSALVVEMRDLPHVQRLLTEHPEPYTRVLRDDWRALGGCAPLGVQLLTLGQAAVLRDGQPVRLRLRRGVELLAYLMAYAPTPREQLLADMWPDTGPRDAANNFHQIKHALEKNLPGLTLPYDPATRTYSLQTDGLRLHWDVQELERQLVSRLEADTERAVTCYGGPFLPSASTPWTEQLRRDLEWRLMKAGLELVERWSIQGDAARCLTFARRLRELDPYNDTLAEVFVDATLQFEGVLAARHLLHEIRDQFVGEVGDFPPRLEALAQHLNKP